MDRQHQIILDMDRIIEAIDAFRSYGTPDHLIVSRIYHLCKFEKEQAVREIDMALDALDADTD